MTEKASTPKRYLVLVIILVLVGVSLRVWKLDKVPVSLFGDEVDVGLQAYSILTTGKDYLGNKFPIIFHSFSEYRFPMQLYMAVPFVKIFGLNELGVRVAPVLAGLLSIAFFYLLVSEIFGKKIGLISALFLTFSPWHFNFSRQANDAGILLPFVILGTFFFIKGRKDFRYLVLSAITYSLSIYSYAISTVFTPLFVAGLLIIFRREIFLYGFKKLVFVAVAAFLVLTPYLFWTFEGVTRERIGNINVATKEEIEAEVAKAREVTGGLLGRLYYNKVTVVGSRLFENYMKAFSPSFLFSRGDPNPRHSIDNFGQMYHYDFFLVLIGLAVGFLLLAKDDARKRSVWVIFLWTILAPLPSILTKGGGEHAARLILMLPPLVVLSSFGFSYLIELKKPVGKLILALVLMAAIFEVSRFMNRYFVIWPSESWRFWHYGFRETISFVKSQDANYKKIYLNNTYEPMLPRFLFWYGYDIGLFQAQFEKDVHSPAIAPGIDGFKLGEKYYFGDLKKPIENLADPDILVVASAEKDATNPAIFFGGGLKLLKVFYSPDQMPIFYVFTGVAKR